MTRSLPSPRRSRARRAALGAAAGLALAVGAPLAAAAHVHVDPGTVAAGSTETLTFTFSHGCDSSPTTALVIEVPDGVGNVTPVLQGGWTITREADAAGIPTRVTFTHDTPVDDHVKASVAMDVLFEESAADAALAFPVTQLCVDGQTAWTQIAEDGQDPHDLEAPAPLVEVGSVATADEHGAAHETANETAAPHDAEAAPAASAGSDADPVARWLAAGGLVAGIAALAVALTRGRTRRG
jgi:uncharacterized protein YcnI